MTLRNIIIAPITEEIIYRSVLAPTLYIPKKILPLLVILGLSASLGLWYILILYGLD